MFSLRTFRLLPVLLALFGVLHACLAAAASEDPQLSTAPVVEIAAPVPAPIRAEVPPAKPAALQEESTGSAVREARFSMFLDETGRLNVESVQEHRAEFKPLDNLGLWRSGALWLALSPADTGTLPAQGFWLDLGLQIPGGTQVWTASGSGWTSVEASASGLYLLQNTGGETLIRLGGLPGLWFRPVLRSLERFGSDPERFVHIPTVAVLVMLSVLCLLLSITEHGEGRIWTAILATAAAVQAVLGVPATADRMTLDVLPGILAAGTALVMLPHEGRALMSTHRTSPFLDVVFLLLALPGACVAALPLIPGWSWTARLLPVWPVMGAICLVPAFCLLVRGVRGSGPFVLACLVMGGSALAALYGLTRGAEAQLWGLALPCGTVVGLVLLTAFAPRRTEIAAQKPVPQSLEIFASEEPEEKVSASLQASLGELAGQLLTESCRLDQALNRLGVGPETVEVMRHADGLVAVSRQMTELVRGECRSSVIPRRVERDFDLREIIQKVFASVSAEADRKDLGLAWYVAPHLRRRYHGDSTRLTALLSLLLTDAVGAAERGAVRLEVRRSLMSTHPGHLLFTVSDNGEGQPPRGRSSLLLSRVWELAAEDGGELFVDSTFQGLELTFGMEFAPLEEDGSIVREMSTEVSSAFPRPDGRLAILAADDGLCRQLCAYYLEGVDCRIREARDGSETFMLYAASPAGLVVFDGSLNEEDMARTLASIRMFEGERSLPSVPFLLLARSEEQAERMSKAGFEEILMQPVPGSDLCALAEWLVSGRSGPRPELSVRCFALGTLSGKTNLRRRGGFVSRRAAVPVPEESALDSSGGDWVELRREDAVVSEEVLELRGDQVLPEESGIRELTEKELISAAHWEPDTDAFREDAADTGRG
ncbi:hypothetical protein [uncultured Mailhella sp.]|uniref:hypothetical protein n=1 Tax=uncultured Mailhella sp. TaxID=1981031 RepID=UPI00262EA5B6|nr:hypothetical protein [uncultured Mailhella sp.]